MRRARWAFVLPLLLFCSCGFRLQGSTPLPGSLKVSYVDAKDHQSDFVLGLRDALRGAGAQLTDRDSDASAVVHVLHDDLARRVLAVTPTNSPAEIELTYTVRFSVSVKGADVLEPQEVSATRDYSFNETTLLAKDNEEVILRQALARDLVSVVMRRLARL
jgi:LPS-assembly lipoprotein